jgi:16S rRNA (adenine1518-N6/adenine1519-N6)-dimethyltransferase
VQVPIRELAARHGVVPTKALGQHFLLDPNLARAIARDAGVGRSDRVVEIGAGLGSLTVALAEAGAAEVLALEFDRGLVPALREAVDGLAAVRVLQADATAVDWRELLPGEGWIACGNLPYNVGTDLTLDLLEHAPVTRIVAMLQREVGARLTAGPGEPGYGPVSLRVAYRGVAALTRSVGTEVFWPRPRVGSVVVRIDRLPAPPDAVDEATLRRVVGAAFGGRRKTIRNAIRRLDLTAAEADAALAAANVDPGRRPEELDLEAYARVAEALAP